ncbi:MAG: nuclear transport factor 2 family protein [Micrococcaceae bacterium]
MTGLTLEHLTELEHRGWEALCASTGDAFYGSLMTDDSVMILVNGVVMDRKAVIASLGHAPAWDTFEIDDERLIPLGPEAAVLVYRAAAHRGQERPFEALMSSTYRRIDGTIRLAVYQQTTATH